MLRRVLAALAAASLASALRPALMPRPTLTARGLFGGASAVDDAQNAEGGTALHSRGARRRAASRETSPKNGPTRAPPGFTDMGAP